jgi:dipeptidyl aminopeptidase/acylaminoacyl peptidase
VTLAGTPGLFSTASASPDGTMLLVSRVKRPFSYLHAVFSFPRDVEIWDRKSGRVLTTVARVPLEENIPIGGVPQGRRSIRWFPGEPSTLVWTEALDGGNPRVKAAYRDRLMKFRAPFQSEPVEIARLQQRVVSWNAIEDSPRALVTDYDRDKRWVRTFLMDFGTPGAEPVLVWSRNQSDRYKDPGTPLSERTPAGLGVVSRFKDFIFLNGVGATPNGDRPFLDRFSLETLKAERIHQSGAAEYETIVDIVSEDGSKFITRKESPNEPPNYYLRSADGAAKALTEYTDQVPQLRRIRKQLVTYKRADGVDLSFTLYLPPDYKEGTRLPAVLYAYPTEYNDPNVAGQVSGSTQRFTTLGGFSHLFYVLAGYAVLDATAFPVVGDPETVNNTYVEQLQMNARAAIDKAAAMGVVDPNRVGAIGHSYGAFMTANLLAHTDLFKAGVARSGAYNRTLTPFGFQAERRTYWEAPETYLRMSPFHYANKINEPLLLIHGQADDNSGTFPVQSERLYQAVRGNGGTVRLVMLPHESHGYLARESVEHTLYEMIDWFDKYVKNAK